MCREGARVSSVLTSGGQSHSHQALIHPGGQQAAAGQHSSVGVATWHGLEQSTLCRSSPPLRQGTCRDAVVSGLQLIRV